MVNQNDILKALQEGQDADTIAQQMTDALNAAIAQKKKIDADKAKTEAARKEQIMQDILNSIFDFIDEFYPDFAVPAEIEFMLKNSDKPKVKASKKANTIHKPTTPDNTILDFLRSQGLA